MINSLIKSLEAKSHKKAVNVVRLFMLAFISTSNRKYIREISVAKKKKEKKADLPE